MPSPRATEPDSAQPPRRPPKLIDPITLPVSPTVCGTALLNVLRFGPVAWEVTVNHGHLMQGE